MPSYVILGKWTEQGLKKITDVPSRVKTANDMVTKAGGKMMTFYTMGQYDFVSMMEVPKDDDAMAIILCLDSMGNTQTMTMKAWSEAEASKLLTMPHPK